MKRQTWRRFAAVVGIVSLLVSNVSDALTVQAVENIPGGATYTTAADSSGLGSASDAAGTDQTSAAQTDSGQTSSGQTSAGQSGVGQTGSGQTVTEKAATETKVTEVTDDGEINNDLGTNSDALEIASLSNAVKNNTAREISLTAECVDADLSDSIIPGHEKENLPAFDGTLDLTAAPFIIDGYTYLEARINGTVAESLSVMTADDEEDSAAPRTYSWTSADGIVTDLTEDTRVTFVYEEEEKIVNVKVSCVDEFGDPIDKKFTDLNLPEFDADGILTLNDTEKPPVKGVQVWKGLFKLIRYKYVQATVDGTIITGLKKEEAKHTAGAYVYSYTADSTVWNKITADATVNFEYTDGKKTVFTYEDYDVVVTATLQHAGAIPDDAELTVTPVTPYTQGYNYDAYMQALNNHADKITDKAATDPSLKFTDKNTLLYDIAFKADKLDEEGNVVAGEKEEFEPTEGMVKITMSFKYNNLTENLKAEKAGDLVVAHLPLSTSAKEGASTTKDATNITASDVSVDVVSDDASVNTGSSDELEFNLGSFSMVTIGNLAGASGDHTVTFSVNGSTNEVAAQSVADGGTVTEPTASLNSSTRTFKGWYTSADAPTAGTKYDFSTSVTGDITLYALFDYSGYSVTNTTYNYASGDTTTYKVDKNAAITYNDGQSERVAVTPGQTFTIPANTQFMIWPTSTTEGVTVTMVPGTAASGATTIAMGTTSAKLNIPSGSSSTSTTFMSQEPQSNVNLTKQWEDNAATSKPAITLSLEYEVEGTTTWVALTAGNMATLGYTTLPSIPEKDDTSNEGSWLYSFSKTLNQYVATGTDAGKTVTYRLAETSAPEGYVSSHLSTDETVLVNTLKKEFSASKVWADGNSTTKRLDVAPWVNAVNAAGGVKRTSLSSTDATTITLTTTDNKAEGYIQVTENGNTWSISMPNALGYDENDLPYTYSIAEPTSLATAVASDTDTYVPTYENVGNAASRLDALFQGGTLTNTLTGSTSYTATKQWKDDGSDATKAARPTATLELYRYPNDGTHDYQSASPVAGVTIDTSTWKAAASNSNISIVTSAGDTLPRYNEDGYEYVYFTKESLSGGGNTYKQVFVNNGTLNGSNRFLFNGAELDNTITGEVSVEGVKTWVAAARQDVDATVTMTVDQYDHNGTLVQAGYRTATLTGFGTESPSKTADFAGLPEYDTSGYKYTYKVNETGVQTSVGGVMTDVTTKSVDGVTYFVTTDGYRYRQDTTTENGTTTVKNTLVGNAQVRIGKTFPDGLLASPTTLTYTIYRDGTAIGTKTVTYQDETAVPFNAPLISITSYEQLDTRAEGFEDASGLLPRYDANGVQYKYTVAETNINSTATYGTTTINSMGEGTDTSADPNENYSLATATISNYKPGEGMSITVHKTWIDASDTLFRQPVQVALQYTADGTTWTNVNTGTIGTDTDYVYVGVPKTVPEGSTGTATYQDLYKTWVTNGKLATGAGSFRVVETALGVNSAYPVVADGDLSIQDNSGHESGSGLSFVTTPNQNYDVSPTATVNADYDFTLTNKRVGTEKIQLTKTWVDGSNVKDSRPATITFTVTASEEVFDDSKSKNFTMTPDTNGVWALDTGWLQKYDYTTGAYITYSIGETKLNYDNGKTDYSSQYARSWSHVGYSVGASHTGDIDTYTLTNKLSASVTPYMNKVWKDDGTTTRPDIYPVLIRTWTDASGSHVEKMSYQDRDWNTKEVTDDWWQCTFVSQPRYTKDGYEYTYYVAEEFSSANYGDYVLHGEGAYEDQPDSTTGAYSEYTDVNETTKKDTVTVTVDGTTYYAAKLDNSTGKAGTIVNKPVATRVVSGTKIWENLPVGSSVRANLPAVTFQLFRYKAGQTEADKVAVKDAGGNFVTTVMPSGTSSFAFTTGYDKYDQDGKPYIYVVEETAPGTMKVAYTLMNDPRSGLKVTNSYISDQHYGITFTKNWNNVPSGLSDTQKPSATLTLVRYLTKSDGNGGYTAIAGTREATFAAAGTNTNTNDNTKTINSDVTSVSWSNLAYYGPNANPYEYRVEETDVPNGYTVYSDAAATTKVTATTINGKTAYVATVSGTYNDTTKAGTATLTNQYGDKGSIKVAKTWAGDTTYGASPRPTTITYKLWRTSASQPLTATTTLVQTISLQSTDVIGTTPWAKLIADLEIYDPHGDAYSYFVTEGADSTYSTSAAPLGYAVSAQTSTQIAPVADSTKASTTSLTNTATTTSLNVTKTWQYNGSVNLPTTANLLFGMLLSAVPESITYGYMYQLEGESTWSVLKDASGNNITKTVTQSNGKFSNVTVSDLPAYAHDSSSVAKAVTYRAYEVSVVYANGNTMTRTAPTSPYDSATLGDATTSSSTTDGTTTVTNNIVMRKLDLTKIWEDEYNRDDVRPTVLDFTVTRIGVNTAIDSATATVRLTWDPTAGTVTASEPTSGKTWDATVSNDGNTWSTSVYVPTYRNDDITKYSSYTVAETAIDGYTTTVGTDGTTYAAAENNSVSITGATTDAETYFKNTRAHTSFDLTPKKVWTYNGTSYTGTTTLPTWLQDYLPTSITFTLQAETVKKNGTVATAWADIDNAAFGTGTDSDFNGIEKTRTATKGEVAFDGTTGAITVDAWRDLPRYASDTDVSNLVTYHYRVVETLGSESQVYTTYYSTDDLSGASVDAGSTKNVITTANAFNVSKLTITKTWVDSKNQYNTRPDAIKYLVEYSADGGATWTAVPSAWMASAAGTNVTVGNDGTGFITIKKAASYGVTLAALPKYASNGTTEYQYRATEKALVYGTSEIEPGTITTAAKPYNVTSSTTTPSTSGEVTTYTTAITNTMPTTSYTINKTWALDGSSPSILGQVTGIRFYLQQKTASTDWSYVTDGTNKDYWTKTFTAAGATDLSFAVSGLPEYDSNGNAYSYRAVEDYITTSVSGKSTTSYPTYTTDPTAGTIGGFTLSVTDSGITNTVVKTSVTATKKWADNNNAKSSRPTQVEFHLLQDGTDLGSIYYKTLTGSTTADTWGSVTWDNLPKSTAAGVAYTYTVTEKAVPGYTSAVTGTQATGYTVTNTPIPVKISKVAADSTTRIAGATFTLDGTFTNGTGEETKSWTSSATDAWDLTGLLVQGTVYTLTETVPPTGYTLPSPAITYLEVKADGKLYKDTSAAGKFTTAVNDNALAVQDAANKVTISKVGADGTTALAGATFTITGTFVDENDQTAKTADNTVITTTANPFSLTGRLIAGNTYTIAETAAPAGYLTMQSTFTVTMGTDGHLTAGTLPTGVTVTIGYDATNGATIKVADQPTSFTADKYETSDTAKATRIAGAVFTVTPAEGKTFSDSSAIPKTFTSTANGTDAAGLTGDLRVDTEYTIQETTAPAGYELASPNPMRTIRITNAGQLEENISDTWTTVTNNALAFFDTATVATLVKQDKATGTGTSPQLGGSTYTITGKFAGDSTATTQTLSPTDTTAASLSTKMIADDTAIYKLKETTPAPGYKASLLTLSYTDAKLSTDAKGNTINEMTLKMNEAGQLYYQNTTGTDTWTAVDGNALVMKDEQNSLTIKKVTSTTKEAGTTTAPAVAVFDITPTTGSSFVDGGTDAMTFVTDGTKGEYGLTGVLVAGSNYTIRETMPPAGYDAVSEFSFTMNADGTIKRDNENATNPAFSYDTNGNPVFTATDPQTHITLTKTDGTNNLAGATFTIKPNQGGKFADGKDTMTWTSETTALDSTNFVAGQTYYFTETTTPDGYVTLPTVTFGGTITANFAVQVGLQGGLTLLNSDGEVMPFYVTIGNNTTGANPSGSITVANTQNKVTLAKHDQDGDLLANARFTITDTADSTKTKNWGSSNTQVQADTLTGWMVAGHSYLFHETSAPDGYLTVPDFTVTMGADGKLTAATEKPLPDGTAGTGSVTLSYDSGTNSVVVKDAQTTVTLNKVDTVTPTPNALAGSTFTVTTENGKFFADGTTTSIPMLSGKYSEVVVGKFVAGDTYTFTESITPENYYTVAPFQVKVNANGTLEFVGDPTDVTISGSTITAADESLNAGMTLTKLDATSGAALTTKATKFTLVGTNGTKTVYPETTLTTDDRGTISVSNLPQGSYTLTETGTDANYTIGDPAFTATFSVTDACKDKTLVINSASLGTATSFNLAVTVDFDHLVAAGLQNVRKTGTVNIQKLGVGDDATGLAGVTFKLYQQLGTDPAPKTDTLVATGETANGTAARGALSFANLAWGNYYLVETAVPAGYQVDATPHAFTIGAGSLPKSFTDTSAITNTKNTFTLAKQDADGKALGGATFTITGVFSDGASEATKTITDQSTTWSGILIGGNTYTVKETTPPADYKAVLDFTVTMGYDGALTAVSGTTLPDGVSIDSKTNALIIKDSLDGFIVTKAGEKVDGKEQLLTATSFSLTEKSTNQQIDSWTIVPNTGVSHSIIGKLVVGTVYELTETAAAPGYTMASPVYLMMDNAGDLYQSTTGADNTWSAVIDNKLIVSDTLTSASVTKQDADGQPLAGAFFSVSGTIATVNGTTSGNIIWMSTATAAELSGSLILDNVYELKETSPAPGYKLSPWNLSYPDASSSDASELVIKVNKSGQLQYQTTENTDTWKNILGNAIIMKDEQNEISVLKTDDASPSNAAIAGAEFTLATGAMSHFADDTTDSITWTSSEVPETLTGKLMAGNEYALSETAPAPGYMISPWTYSYNDAAPDTNGALVIKVDEFGQLWYKSTADGGWTEVKENAIAMRDARNAFTLEKQDSTGAALSGATFTITPVSSAAFADGTTTELSVTAQSETLTGKLAAGETYRITETKAPAFYYPAEAFDVTMDAAGTLSAADGTELPLGVSISGNRITVKDYQTSVSISKVDADGVLLPGAVLRITDAAGNVAVSEWTSAASPEVITGKLIAGEQYILEEVTAPSGYNKADPVTFTVENTAEASEMVMRTYVTMTDEKTPSSPGGGGSGSGGGGNTPGRNTPDVPNGPGVPSQPANPTSPTGPTNPVYGGNGTTPPRGSDPVAPTTNIGNGDVPLYGYNPDGTLIDENGIPFGNVGLPKTGEAGERAGLLLAIMSLLTALGAVLLKKKKEQ